MAAFTGISLVFDDTGLATVIHAKKILPHRIDLIEARMKNNDLDGLIDMFFNFDVPDCHTALTRDHVIRENKLFKTYLKLTEKIIDFPESNSHAPEAA